VIDRTGDIKLELNGEYRFPITPLFAGAVKMNGAIFADAGNIWLAKAAPGFPGGEFNFATLGQTIAADIGAGARFDIASFLTFRVDLAMPVKKPYVHTNSGWVFNSIDFGNNSWRYDNLVLNISIGYPF
jgi:outer membrane protein assembly factor BamA